MTTATTRFRGSRRVARISAVSLAVSLAAVFVAILLLSGLNVTAALTIVAIIVLALVNLAGFMRLADIRYI